MNDSRGSTHTVRVRDCTGILSFNMSDSSVRVGAYTGVLAFTT